MSTNSNTPSPILNSFLKRLNLMRANDVKPFPVEVTPLLKLACNDLGNNELIRGEEFDHSAYMSLVKGLDQKLCQDFVSMNYYVDEAIDAAPVPLSSDRTIDTQRLIDVMDHLLTCEATWHEGASFRQTIYSCIYLRSLDRVSSHPLLHSLCRSITVTCNAISLAISSARTDNEVLRNSYYGSSKGNRDGSCLSTLQSIEETIIRKLKACTLSKKKDYIGVEPLQTTPEYEEDFCKAILCRLRFRKHFYHVLTSMRRTEGKGLEMAKKHIDFCLVELDSMLKSEEFLKSLCRVVEDSLSEHKTTASGCQPVGFDSPINCTPVTPTAINRVYATLTGTRAVQLLSWKKAVSYFLKLLNDLSIICSNSPCPVLEDAVQFVVDFQKFQPGCVARAHIQLLLVQNGKLYGRESLFATICEAALLPESAKNHDIRNHQTIAELEKLLTHLLKVICTTIEVQRMSLGKTLVDWEQIFLQLEATFTALSGNLTNPPNMFDVKVYRSILGWVCWQKDWIVLRFILLGFELDLYAPSDYCMVYGYIGILLTAIARGRFITFQENNDPGSATRNVRKRRALLKPGKEKEHDVPHEVTLLLCYTNLVQGFIKILGILRNDYKAFQCVGPFNSEEERYIQHFKPLHEAGYSTDVSYSGFKKEMDNVCLSNLTKHDSFKEALKMVRKLQVVFAKDPSRLAELNQVAQVAERNGRFLNQIRGISPPDPSLKFSFEFVHHPHFAVASLERSS